MSVQNKANGDTVIEYVTVLLGGQLFGLPISRVQDVFMPERLTRVPLSSAEIAGVLNLRGRIVTVIDMRARLGVPKADDGKPPMAVGVDLRGESYGLLIDQIGEVLRLPDDGREENPVNLDPRMAKFAGGVHRLDADHRAVVDDLARGDRAWPRGRLPRICCEIRSARPDRRAQGADGGDRGSGVTETGR